LRGVTTGRITVEYREVSWLFNLAVWFTHDTPSRSDGKAFTTRTFSVGVTVNNEPSHTGVDKVEHDYGLTVMLVSSSAPISAASPVS
jgi:hypothetical protein